MKNIILLFFLILITSCSVEAVFYDTQEVYVNRENHQIELIYKSTTSRSVTVLSHNDGELYNLSAILEGRSLESDDLYNYPVSTLFKADKIEGADYVAWENIEVISEPIDVTTVEKQAVQQEEKINKISNKDDIISYLKELVLGAKGIPSINGGYMLVDLDPQQNIKIHNKVFGGYLSHYDVIVYPDGYMSYFDGYVIDLSKHEIHLED